MSAPSKVTYCDKAIAPDCTGHSAFTKWPDCVSEECWQYPDETTGNVDGFGYFVALIIQEKDETTSAGILVKAGTYLTIREDDQKFIEVLYWKTAQAAQDAFDRWESAYGDWCHGEDMREAQIMATSGRIGR